MAKVACSLGRCSLVQQRFNQFISMASYITTIAMMAGLTFVMSLWSVGIIRQSLQHQLLDVPNERSSHSQPTPRGGGLGFIVAFAIAVLITWVAFPSLILDISLEVWLMLIPLVGIGIWDDWRNLTAGVRYLIQLSVAAGVVYRCGIFLVPGLEELGGAGVWVAAGLTMIGLTALINFYNFMDGLDGLVAGVATVQLGFLALWCHQPGLWLRVAALIGFLYWNWAPAKIFMGDVGSTTLGAVVGDFAANSIPVEPWGGLDTVSNFVANRGGCRLHALLSVVPGREHF